MSKYNTLIAKMKEEHVDESTTTWNTCEAMSCISELLVDVAIHVDWIAFYPF